MSDAGFLGRMHELAAGRKFTPWLKSLGWSNGVISSVAKGHIPGPDLLLQLARAERCNMHWLLTGQGEPRLGPAPPAVREATATYAALTPAKRQLLEALDGMDEKAVKALLEFVRRR